MAILLRITNHEPLTTIHMSDQFDLIVIGAGPGGYVAATRAAQLGMRVAIVDRRGTLGGTCLNVGCIPSKALLDSSELFAQARAQFGKHGIKVGEVQLDLGTMLARKDGVVKNLTEGVAFLMRKNHVTVIHGTARLASPGKVAVRKPGSSTDPETSYEAKAILLATGSEPSGLLALPFDGTHVVSSTEALSFDQVPEHLIVIGGGYIGLELGSVWARLGAKVTVLEFLPRILPLSDRELAELLFRALERQGLKFHLETKVTGGSVSPRPLSAGEGKAGDRKERGKVTVQAEDTRSGAAVEYQADRVLVAVGRRPYTAGLGLQEAGVSVDTKTGRVPVNEDYRTNVPGIYAIGDLIEGPMLAHKAEDEGVAFAERLAGKQTEVNYHAIPSVIYTHPELASVGFTEEQLQQQKREYNVGKFPFSANGRARCLGETEGLVKILADKETDRVLGVHILGPRASDLIAEAVSVIEFGGSAEDIARTCHAHPTLSEAVREAALAVDRRALHLPPPA
jgi:dihydrolipoamide dehydrogenase